MTGTHAPNTARPAPPRTQGLPIVGALPALLHRPFPFFLEARERYGDVYTLDLGMLKMTVLNQPRHAQHILADRSTNYRKGGALWDSVRTLLGNGLAVSEGRFWLRQRRMIQPHFHRQRLDGLTSLMVEAIDAGLQGWEAPAAAQTPFNLSPAFAAMTMQVIVKALFGQGLVQAQVDTVSTEMSFVVDYLLWGVLAQSLPRRLPLPGARRYQQALRTIDAVVQMMIEQQRRAPEPADHLLAMLLQMVDAETGEQMTDPQLRDEVVTFFLAGYETTSLTLSWSLHFLTQHPETLARLVAEVDSVLACRAPTFADIPNLAYTSMVVQEALRMRPPAWHLTRTAIEADTIDGFSIPAGTTVAVHTYAIQHHPEHWEQPQRFEPERFAPERSADRHKYAWIPFGAGRRQCIGKDLALMEAQLILAMLLQRYAVAAIPGSVAESQLSTSLKPRGGVQVRLSMR